MNKLAVGRYAVPMHDIFSPFGKREVLFCVVIVFLFLLLVQAASDINIPINKGLYLFLRFCI